MAKLTFTIPDSQITEVVDALAYSYHYPETIAQTDSNGQLQTVPNPQSKRKFVRQAIACALKERVKHAKAQIATEAANKTAMDDAEQNISITG